MEISERLRKLQEEIHETHQGLIVLLVVLGLITVFTSGVYDIVKQYSLMLMMLLFGLYLGIRMIDSQIDAIMESE